VIRWHEPREIQKFSYRNYQLNGTSLGLLLRKEGIPLSTRIWGLGLVLDIDLLLYVAAVAFDFEVPGKADKFSLNSADLSSLKPKLKTKKPETGPE
jgi:hypothetical protein